MQNYPTCKFRLLEEHMRYMSWAWLLYTQNAFAYTFEPKIWDLVFYLSSEGLLMIRIQNVCGKAILMCLIPISVGVYPIRVLAPI